MAIQSKSKFKKMVTCCVAGLLVCGCTTLDGGAKASSTGVWGELNQSESAVAKKMGLVSGEGGSKVTNEDNYSKVTVLKSGFPYRAKRPIQSCESGVMLEPPIVVKEGTIKAVEGYLKRYGVNVVVAGDVPSTAVFRMSVDSPMPLCAFLSEVSRQTGVKFYMPDSETVVFTHMDYQVFSLPILPGKQNITLRASESDSIGTEVGGKGGAGGAGGIISSSNTIDRDPYQEIKENLTTIIGKDGFFFFDRSTGDIHIFAVPEKMVLARKYMENAVDRLGKQIVVRLTVLSVEDSDTRKTGVNWYWALQEAVVNNPWKWGLRSGVMTFPIGGGSEVIKDTRGTYNFGMRAVAGDPHQFIVRLLKEYTNVRVIDSTEVAITNGMGTFVSSGEYTEYIKELERTTGDTAGTTNVSVNKGTTFSGMRFYVSGAIIKDVINLQLYLDIEDLLDLKTLNFGENLMVQNPTVTKKKNMTTVQARDGETVALVSMMKDKHMLSKSGPGIPLIDDVLGQKDSDGKKKHIVFLITPRVIKNM